MVHGGFISINEIDSLNLPPGENKVLATASL
jgi:hypothetical protein